MCCFTFMSFYHNWVVRVNCSLKQRHARGPWCPLRCDYTDVVSTKVSLFGVHNVRPSSAAFSKIYKDDVSNIFLWTHFSILSFETNKKLFYFIEWSTLTLLSEFCVIWFKERVIRFRCVFRVVSLLLCVLNLKTTTTRWKHLSVQKTRLREISQPRFSGSENRFEFSPVDLCRVMNN